MFVVLEQVLLCPLYAATDWAEYWLMLALVFELMGEGWVGV